MLKSAPYVTYNPTLFHYNSEKIGQINEEKKKKIMSIRDYLLINNFNKERILKTNA